MSAGSRVREDDVVLLRAGSGTIHIGVPLGRGFDTMCCHLIDSRHVRTFGPDAGPGLIERSARYLCEECMEVSEKPWPTICTITGWR